MNRPEQYLHRSVAEFLDLALDATSFWLHVPNGGGRTKAEAGILKSMGVKAGVPDILIVHAGRAHWIELKAPPKILKSGQPSHAKPAISDDQERVIEALRLAGSRVGVCRSIGEVQAQLDVWGIRIRTRVAA